MRIDLDRELFVELKCFAFRRNLSIHEIFEEFTAHLISGNAGARSIVDGLLVRKQKKAIEELDAEPFPSKKLPPVPDPGPESVEHDSIYDFLAQNDPHRRNE